MCVLKLQRSALSVVVGAITGHCIMDTPANCIGPEKEEETVPYLLGTCPALLQRRRKYLRTYYVSNLEELSRIDTGSLNCFIRSFE